jgi:TRAP transporter TAXI family solute receptor
VTDAQPTEPHAGHRARGLADGVAENVRHSKVFYLVFVGLGFVVAAVLLLIARSIDPAPPRQVRLATGVAGGAYAATGEALRARLAVDGVELELVATSGSVENLGLLARDDGVDIAIVQGGVGLEQARDGGFESLGGLFYEPLWVFARSGAAPADLRELRGRRAAVGPEGSGVRALATLLLADNGLAEGDVTLSPLGGDAAAAALRSGETDVAVFVTSPDTGYVRALLLDPEIELVSFARAEAYARRHRYLSAITLPRGVIDLARDAPAQDVALVAPAAALVVKRELHPAIQSLLLAASDESFRLGGVLAPPGAFPSRDLVTFPLSEEAERFYERGGPSLLRRWLPFWAANLVDRLWVLAIPAATLLYPLMKSAPPVYKWQVQRRVHRWYRDLRRLEAEGRDAADAAIVARVRADLRRMMDEVGGIKVPLSYNDDVYRLRMHIRMVEQIVAEARPSPP